MGTTFLKKNDQFTLKNLTWPREISSTDGECEKCKQHLCPARRGCGGQHTQSPARRGCGGRHTQSPEPSCRRTPTATGRRPKHSREKKSDYGVIAILRNIDKNIWILRRQKEIHQVNSNCFWDSEALIPYLCRCDYNREICQDNIIFLFLLYWLCHSLWLCGSQ